MTVHLNRHDVVFLLGLAATGGLAVSLGVHPLLVGEVVVVLMLLFAVSVLLRTSPPSRRRRSDQAPMDSLAEARSSVEAALAGPWGARGRFSRRVKAVAVARLARDGRTLEDVGSTLPPAALALLSGKWPDDRGLTADELDLVLSTLEELE